MQAEQLRSLQAPLKEQYRQSPESAKIAMHAEGTIDMESVACHVKPSAGRTADGARAGLHAAAGGNGSFVCSGDMLLEALVACSGVTFAAVATAMEIPITAASIKAIGVADFRGTLGIAKDVSVGFESVTVQFDVSSEADDAAIEKLISLAERYCVVGKSLSPDIKLEFKWTRT
jgi:uncharacterized OsmC-like protein